MAGDVRAFSALVGIGHQDVRHGIVGVDHAAVGEKILVQCACGRRACGEGTLLLAFVNPVPGQKIGATPCAADGAEGGGM